MTPNELRGRVVRRRSLVRAVTRRIRRFLRLPKRDAAERAYRKEIRDAGASMHPMPLSAAWKPWANRALRSRGEVDAAIAMLREAGLAPHGDRPKNWDALVALGTLLDRVSRRQRILDMGATQYSPLLRWLYQYGYRRLVGIDLVYEEPVRRGPIEYLPMDLTATTFPDASFAGIACLSVIEHGVDIDRFLAESARLLSVGGVLVVSTDYWPEPMDVGDRQAYGHAVRIFDRSSLADLVERGKVHGLEPIGTVDLSAGERAVRWERMDLDYTFAVLVLRRAGRAGRGVRA
jgi:SAM-dependent methyltransferase